MATLTIAEQVNGEMVDISCDSIRGLTVRECYALWDGKKIIAELVQTGGGGFICGTEKARDYKRAKGFKALTFAEALEIQKAAPYMDEIIVPESFTLQGEVCKFEWGQNIGQSA